MNEVSHSKVVMAGRKKNNAKYFSICFQRDFGREFIALEHLEMQPNKRQYVIGLILRDREEKLKRIEESRKKWAEERIAVLEDNENIRRMYGYKKKKSTT